MIVIIIILQGLVFMGYTLPTAFFPHLLRQPRLPRRLGLAEACLLGNLVDGRS